MTPTRLQDPLPTPLHRLSVCLSVSVDVTTRNKMRRALNFPFSPYSVGLITTSYSVLRPLRKRRTLLKQNALAKNMAFLNCNSVTDSASSCVWDLLLLTVGATSTAAFTELFRQSCLLPIWALRDLFFGPVFISGTVLRKANNWGISEESLPRRKDS